MGQLDPFSLTPEHHRMLADDVAGADGLEADGPAVARAGAAYPPVDRALGEVAAQRAGDDLAHAHRGPRRRIDLVTMVRLDDLDVHAVAERPRRDVEELEAEVDPDAHVRGVHDGDVAGRILQRPDLVRGQAGGADDHRAAPRPARPGVFDGRLRQGEVDADLGGAQHPIQGILDPHPDLADAGDRPGIRPDVGLAFPLDSARDRHTGLGVDRLHEHPPHPAGRAGDRDRNGIHDLRALPVAGLEQRRCGTQATPLRDSGNAVAGIEQCRVCHVLRVERIGSTDDRLQDNCSLY